MKKERKGNASSLFYLVPNNQSGRPIKPKFLEEFT
jgi:hypothetical protein